MSGSSPLTAGGGRPALPALRVVYRSHGGENDKDRPAFYSKLLSLASMVRAVETARDGGVRVELIWWNDGLIPADRLDLMRASGEVVQIEGGSNRASYRAAVDAASRFDGADSDVVWFAEDDYLYLPDSMLAVARGAASLPHADYLSVFGGLALDETSPRTATRRHDELGSGQATDRVEVDGTTWYRGVSTTSTFGVRLGVLRADRRLLRTVPYSGGSWDHTTCLTVQGRQPFAWGEIREEVLPLGAPPKEWPASVARGLVRAAVNVRSHRADENCRTLYLADPILAAHLEQEVTSWPGADWAARARELRDWAVARGIPVRAFGGEPAGEPVTDR